MTECILVEKLCRVCAGTAGGILVQSGLATEPIYRVGSQQLKERFLYSAIRGEKIGAFVLTEPDADRMWHPFAPGPFVTEIIT